jgi:hypothetical protein
MINLLRSLRWISILAVVLVVASIILMAVSTQDFFPLAIVFSLAANALATLAKE